MADLVNDQTPMLLSCTCELLERFESFTTERVLEIDDHVPACLKLIIRDHYVSRMYHAKGALSPSTVKVD